MGGPNSFPDPWTRDFRPVDDSHGRPNWRPNHLEGQLTIPGYVTVGQPSNKEIILGTIIDRRTRWKALGDIAFLATMDDRARPAERLVEQWSKI